MRKCKFIEPISKNEFEFTYIPLSQLKASPFQREISKAHIKNLALSIEKHGFLTPILVVESENEDEYFVVDGQHRIVALMEVIPDSDIEVPCIILPKKYLFSLDFNVEKVPNIKERSKQVYKFFKYVLDENPEYIESRLYHEIEKGYYITCGICLEEVNDRFSPSIFESWLKKVDDYLFDYPVKDTYKERQKRAIWLNELQTIINAIFDEIGSKNYFIKQAIFSKAFRLVYGERVRSIEDNFKESYEKLRTCLEVDKDTIINLIKREEIL